MNKQADISFSLIEGLVREHDIILRALRVLSFLANNKIENEKEYKEELTHLVSFFKEYVDKFHHFKEEKVLFKWLNDKGFPTDSGPIACMLSEHETGRNSIRHIESALANENQKFDSRKIVKEINKFINHLEQHIFKENNVLYPMAQDIGDDKSITYLEESVEEHFSDSESKNFNFKYENVISNLENKYQI